MVSSGDSVVLRWENLFYVYTAISRKKLNGRESIVYIILFCNLVREREDSFSGWTPTRILGKAVLVAFVKYWPTPKPNFASKS